MKPYLVCSTAFKQGKFRSDYRRAVGLYHRTCKDHPHALVRLFSIEPNGYSRLVMQRENTPQ